MHSPLLLLTLAAALTAVGLAVGPTPGELLLALAGLCLLELRHSIRWYLAARPER